MEESIETKETIQEEIVTPEGLFQLLLKVLRIFYFEPRIFLFGWMTLLTHSGQVSAEDTEEHEDSQKIKVPDPSIDEEHGKMKPLETPEKENDEDTTLIEGAWADILGSGQLKKKVSLAF